MSEKPDLETRVRQFERLELPGQMPIMHMGTAYLVGDLWREIGRLRAALVTISDLPDARCDEAPTVARNTLNDGTRPPPVSTEDQGPDVLGMRKGEE